MTESKANKILLLHGAKDLRLETRPITAPPAGEVQVQIFSTGLCGSDLHYWAHNRNGDFAVRAPLCLGHESSGLVVAAGEACTLLKVGDRVALEVGLACGKCPLCNEGRYNICPTLLFKSSAKTFPHADGTLSEYMNHPETLCHKIPDNITYDAAALIEPLSVSIHGVRRSRAPLGASVLVFGAGAIGLLTAAVLQARGMSDVVVADIDETRLKIALDLGLATTTFLIPMKPRKTDITEILADAQALAKDISASVGVAGFERVFECTGVPSCVQTGIYASLPGGALTLIGMGTAVQTLPLGAAALREVDIIGVFRYANTYPTAIKLMTSGKLKGIEKLITHRVALGEATKAFELAGAGKDEEGKAVVKVVVYNDGV